MLLLSCMLLLANHYELLCIKNNKERFQKLYTALNKHSKDAILIGMEDTEHYHFSIESSLLAEGYKVALINPIITKNLRKASLKTIKGHKENAILIRKALLGKDCYRTLSIQDKKLKKAKEYPHYRTQLTIEMNRKNISFEDTLISFFLNLIHYSRMNTLLLM